MTDLRESFSKSFDQISTHLNVRTIENHLPDYPEINNTSSECDSFNLEDSQDRYLDPNLSLLSLNSSSEGDSNFLIEKDKVIPNPDELLSQHSIQYQNSNPQLQFVPFNSSQSKKVFWPIEESDQVSEEQRPITTKRPVPQNPTQNQTKKPRKGQTQRKGKQSQSNFQRFFTFFTGYHWTKNKDQTIKFLVKERQKMYKHKVPEADLIRELLECISDYEQDLKAKLRISDSKQKLINKRFDETEGEFIRDFFNVLRIKYFEVMLECKICKLKGREILRNSIEELNYIYDQEFKKLATSYKNYKFLEDQEKLNETIIELINEVSRKDGKEVEEAYVVSCSEDDSCKNDETVSDEDQSPVQSAMKQDCYSQDVESSESLQRSYGQLDCSFSSEEEESDFE